MTLKMTFSLGRIFILFCAALLIAMPAVAEHISFQGEVSEKNPKFTRSIPGGLIFSFARDWKQTGWTISIGEENVGWDFINFETPPLRGANAAYSLAPGVDGVRPYDVIAVNLYNKATYEAEAAAFCFLADKKFYKTAQNALATLDSDATTKERKNAANILNHLPAGLVNWVILDATIAGKDFRIYEKHMDDMNLPITSVKFKVDIMVPVVTHRCGWRMFDDAP